MLKTYLTEYFMSFLFYSLLSFFITACMYDLINKKAGRLRLFTNQYMRIFIFTTYMLLLLAITVLPEIELTVFTIAPPLPSERHFNFIPFRQIAEAVSGGLDDALLNILGNIVMFIPYGFFLPLVFRRHDSKVVLIAACCSIFIEFIQFFEGRRCDIDDVILNTIGAYTGWVLIALIRKYHKKTRN